jgi:heme/copper-type cytochrome/quinol oxidase subunit 2
MPSMLPSIGTMEVLIVLLSVLFWFGVVIVFFVFLVRFLRRETDKDRTIATLVEENQRLRDALAEK